MSDLAKLRIWDDPAIRGALSWYLDVAENRRPAKFRIASTVATQLDPAASSEDALWAELDRLTPIFLARWEAIRAGVPLPRPAEGPSLLELCRELAYRMLATAISVRGIAASTERRVPSSVLANWPPVHASVHISITPERSCSIAAPKARAQSSSPLATCGAPFARTAISAPTKTTAKRWTPARWRQWHGRYVARVATISIGWAARSSFISTPLSTRSRCWAATSLLLKRSCDGCERPRPIVSFGSTRSQPPPSMTGSSIRRCFGIATSS